MSSPSKATAKRRLVMASNQQSQPKFQAVADIHRNIFVPVIQEQEQEVQTLCNIQSNFNHFLGRRSQGQVNIPAGFRFCPYDGELIKHYLKRKVENKELPHNGIVDVNVYEHNPDYLTDRYPALREKHWYFFTPRDRKTRNGNRPNRTAGDGFWKATGKDQPVRHNCEVIGSKRALVFYHGKPKNGEKTNWIMHEFKAYGPPRIKEDDNDMKLDWVLCMIYKKEKAKGKTGTDEELDNNEPTADATALLSSSIADENEPMAENSREHDHIYFQSTQHPQVSQSVDGFLPDYSLEQDVFLSNMPTTLWGSEENCGLYPDNGLDDELGAILTMPTADATTLFADENDPMAENSHELDYVHFQSTLLPQISQSTDGFLPNYSLEQDDFLSDVDTTIWGLEEHCGLHPDKGFDDELGAILGRLDEDCGLNDLDGLLAPPPSLTGQNYDVLV